MSEGTLIRLPHAALCDVDGCRNPAYWRSTYGAVAANLCYACMAEMSRMNSGNEEAFAPALAEAKRMREVIEQIASGKVCPICKQPVTERRQVSKCVYHAPCGHHYQGQLQPQRRPVRSRS